MDIRPAMNFLVPALLALSLAACGNKGPLVLPTTAVDPDLAPATPTGEVPVELAPAQADTDTSDEIVEDGLLINEDEATDPVEPPADDAVPPDPTDDDDGNG